MLSVATPAEATALTALATVKAELGISGATEDAWLTQIIGEISRTICDHLNTAEADDGTSTLGRETLVETVDLGEYRSLLQLSRRPLVSVSSVVHDGETIAAEGYELRKAGGFLARLDGGKPIEWSRGRYVVSYIAGWILPGDENRNLPEPIERAVIDMVKIARSGRTRDPLVRSENTPNVLAVEYWTGGVAGARGEAGVPPDIADRLSRYVHDRY